MVIHIQKWGNSLAMRVPKAFATEAGITDGTPVDLSVEDGALIARPQRKPTVRLRNLMAGVTRSNRHREADFGTPVGGEAW